MSKLLIGTIQNMIVQEELNDSYRLANDAGQVMLPKADDEQDIQINSKIDVFIYPNKKGHEVATQHLPTAKLDVFGWGEVVEVFPNLGVFINLGTAIDVLVSMDELPIFQEVWPASGDKLYVRLAIDKKERLLAVPAAENDFSDVYAFAENLELNDSLTGHVIRPGREGTVIITEERYRGFIHHSEREKEPRLGEHVSGRIIEVKEDGTINVSLLPLKHERIDDDAEKILQYITEHEGVIPFGNKTDPDAIRDTFQMSKSAFKRALGRLMKEGLVEQADGETFLKK